MVGTGARGRGQEVEDRQERRGGGGGATPAAAAGAARDPVGAGVQGDVGDTPRHTPADPHQDPAAVAAHQLAFLVVKPGPGSRRRLGALAEAGALRPCRRGWRGSLRGQRERGRHEMINTGKVGEIQAMMSEVETSLGAQGLPGARRAKNLRRREKNSR